METAEKEWKESDYSNLRTVNVYKDEGIWILLDEGCNSNCHGKEWAKNTEEKLRKYPGIEFSWVNKAVKQYQGIGTTKVKTYGKRCMPASIKLSKGRVVKCSLEWHEQDGRQPVLLSGPSQAELGLMKDVRK